MMLRNLMSGRSLCSVSLLESQHNFYAAIFDKAEALSGSSGIICKEIRLKLCLRMNSMFKWIVFVLSCDLKQNLILRESDFHELDIDKDEITK